MADDFNFLSVDPLHLLPLFLKMLLAFCGFLTEPGSRLFLCPFSIFIF